MEDWRFDWTNSLSAGDLQAALAQGQPAYALRQRPGPPDPAALRPLGEPTNLTVQVPLKNLDMFLTTSIVINF